MIRKKVGDRSLEAIVHDDLAPAFGSCVLLFFSFGAVQRCANLVDLEQFMNVQDRILTRKNRLRYSRERALQKLANLG